MFGIGISELLIILALATIVVGPEGMIKFSRQLGEWVAKFRRETDSVTREFKSAFDMELLDPTATPTAKPATRAAPGTVRQWNLPTSDAAASPSDGSQAESSAQPATDDGSSVEGADELSPELAEAIAASTFADDDEDGEMELPSVRAARLAEEASVDAGGVELGIAEWIPEDENAEATVIGEPLLMEPEGVPEPSEPERAGAGPEEAA